MSKDIKIPTQQEIQEDLRKFLEEKYGGKVAFADADYIGSKEGVKGDENINIDHINFTLKPEELEEYLNKYVVMQEDAVAVLATKICTHFHRMNYERKHPEAGDIVGHVKSNILMIGPTGVGKTYIVKLIANKIGVPFVKGDATKFSETGYVGGDVEDLVRDLVAEAKGSIKMAEYGIIYIDEIDKIASSQGLIGPDVSRTGVQRNLLKLMEETEVDLKVPHDLASQMEAVIETQRTGKAPRKKINTKNILFVVSGAFSDLDDIIRKRLNHQAIGFRDKGREKMSKDQYLSSVRSEDLMKYGFESEFVGRLPVITRLKELGVEGLYKILKNQDGAVTAGKMRDFTSYGIQLSFEDDALRQIAEMAEKEKTGARGLVSVMEHILIPFEKKLPSSDIKKLKVTIELVENPQIVLKRIMIEDALNQFQKRFLVESGVVLEFTAEAKKHLLQTGIEYDENFSEYLKKAFKDYNYGLKLIGRDSFKVNMEVIKDPSEYLNILIKRSYKKKRSENDVSE
ncbi:AAA family ATPase [bacterium]|nr:AAA family ATPase [bacterium]